MEKFLPVPLPLGEDAFSPYLNKESITYHYHAVYLPAVNRLNVFCDGIQGSCRLEELIKSNKLPKYCRAEILKEAKNTLCHQYYFSSLSSSLNGFFIPTGILSNEINKAFGSWHGLLHAVFDLSKNMEMPGFLWLLADRFSGKVKLLKTYGHELPNGSFHVLFCLDLWEHAWLFQYPNNPLTYVEAFFHILNMKRISKEYEKLYARNRKRNQREKG